MATDDQDGVKTAQFYISAALFEELGERLVSKPEIALAELIKNSYDADAKTCTVNITPTEIEVSDNGHGLTEHEFLNNWMVVSSSKKALDRRSRTYKRSMAGSKGVGRFSARFLGTMLTVRTTARDPKTGRLATLRAEFDWEKISQQTKVSDIKISYWVTPASRNAKTGMTLTIKALRENISDLPIAKVRSDVLRLVDAAEGLEEPDFVWSDPEVGDPGFEVEFPGDEDYGDDPENLAKSILDRYVARARVSVDTEGTVDFKIFWKDKAKPVEKKTFKLSTLARPYLAKTFAAYPGKKNLEGLPEELEGIDYLPLARAMNSPVFIDIRFFPKRQGTFAGLPVNGKRAMSWVKEHAGISVVDNGFAMPAYAAESSDWLGVEASKAKNERNWQSVFTPTFYPMDPTVKRSTQLNPMLALPRMSQLIGRVHVATQKVPAGVRDDDNWLHPNMDREQLRDNGAYRLLWHLVRFTIEALAHYDRSFRIIDDQAREELARENAREGLSATIAQISASSEINDDHKQVILRQLYEVEEQYSAAEEHEKNVRMSLELMSLMGVMAGFMTHEFDKTLESIHSAGQILKLLARDHDELREHAETVLRNEKALSQQAEYMRLYVGHSRKITVTAFRAKAQLKAATRTLQSLAEDHGIEIEIDVDAMLPGPTIPLMAYHGVVVNLVSNAMKALVAKAGDGVRKVKLFAFNDDNKHVLVCSDNGIGIPPFLRERIWDPLYSTTENSDDRNPMTSGLGLGLPLVKRVVDGVSGKIELMKTAPPEFSTAFRVTFPIN